MGQVNTRVTDGAHEKLTEKAKAKDLTLYQYSQLVLQAVARGDTELVISLMNRPKS
jgi:predicted HicB family RNase H-like nuclease